MPIKVLDLSIIRGINLKQVTMLLLFICIVMLYMYMQM